MRRTLLALAALLASCGSKPEAANPAAAAVPAVAVIQVQRQAISNSLDLVAEFRPYREIDLMAKVSGYVNRISVDIGDRVRTGSILATLEIPEMNDDLARAKASIDRSTSDVARARDEIRRAESANEMALLNFSRLSKVMSTKPGLIAQQDIDNARARSLETSAQLAAAKSALASAEHNVKVIRADENRVQTMFNYTRVTAPFDGVITRRYAEIGAMVQAGTSSQTNVMPIVRLSQDNMLRLQLPIPESVVPKVKVGFPIRINVPTLSRTIDSRITRFSGQLSMATRTMEAQVDIPNSDLSIKPGMFAEVVFMFESKPQALVIPLLALDGSGEIRKVMVVNASNKVEERTLSTGIETPDSVEILTGLEEGEKVVLSGRSQLVAGMKVTPRLSSTSTQGAKK
jgi:RND family efflux transporter MFP subunit